MSASYDVIIAGMGAMGSAAAFHLARSGQRVLALDRYAPPHKLGSSHGQTRIIREAYFEHPLYVPLVQRAYELWEETARLAHAQLFQQTGGLMIARPDEELFRGAKQSADTHRLAYEVLSAQEVRKQFPALHPEDTMQAIWEPRAGILFPERCIGAHLALATQAGADLRPEEPMLTWKPTAQGVDVRTSRSQYAARFLILCAGPWVGHLLPELKLPFVIERQVMFWFEADRSPALFYPEHCPIHLWQFDQSRFFYGLPDLGDGIKVACHHEGEMFAPDQVRREVAPAEVDAMRGIVQRFLPGANGRLRSAAVCLYTNTPDGHFWIDRHPQCPQMIIASPCSGHGFKFSSVIGEILRDLVVKGQSQFDLRLFQTRGGTAAVS